MTGRSAVGDSRRSRERSNQIAWTGVLVAAVSNWNRVSRSVASPVAATVTPLVTVTV